MLLKMEAQCQKLEREWMAARYVLPVGVLRQFEGWYSWPSIRDLYKEFVKDVGLERAPALLPDHWGVISELKQELQEIESTAKHSCQDNLLALSVSPMAADGGIARRHYT